jgi:hypothetical protein
LHDTTELSGSFILFETTVSPNVFVAQQAGAAVLSAFFIMMKTKQMLDDFLHMQREGSLIEYLRLLLSIRKLIARVVDEYSEQKNKEKRANAERYDLAHAEEGCRAQANGTGALDT